MPGSLDGTETGGGVLKTDTDKSAVPVLILSAHAIALGVVRSLGPAGVPVYLVSYDKKDMAHKSKYVRECFFLPHPEKNQDAFIQGLLKIGKKIGRAVVFAADDPTLTTLSKNIDALKSAFIIPTPDWSIVKKIINKNITYSIAEREGIPVPKTLLLDISSPLPSDVLRTFKFPCLIKPVQSHTYYEVFKKKMAVVTDVGELEVKFNECRKHGIDVTVQEIIPGEICRGFNFNSLFYDGRIRQGFAAYKIRMTDNSYGIPVVVRSRAMIQELWDYSETLLKAIGYEGYSCIEYKFDQRDGLYKLLEVNGRYNRSSLLSVRAGINFPQLEYSRITHGGDIVQKEYKTNIYYIDEFKDWQININSLLRCRQNIFSFLRPYFSRHVFAVFSVKDPGPFFKHAGDGLTLLAKRGDEP
jgi:predicted ATP-grasp superfamily ATP-dependent carboligase